MANLDFDGRTSQHLSLDGVRRVGAFAAPKRKIVAKPLRGDYVAHGAALLDQLAAALPPLAPGRTDTRLPLDGLKPGVLVALETLAPNTIRKGPSKVPLAFEIARDDLIILQSRRTSTRAEESIVFVPDDARAGLKRRLTDYGRSQLGNLDRPNLAQFERLERIVAAEAIDLMVGELDLTDSTIKWWELWVRNVRTVPAALVAAARRFNLDVHPQELRFADTTVIFIHATGNELLSFASKIPGAIEEIRPGLGTIEPFLTLSRDRVTQHDFVADLAGRIIPARSDAPSICILDTGVAAAHPLLVDGLSIAIALDVAWGSDDHYRHGGHGTSVASLALLGDLEHAMNDQRIIELTHTVESVKLLPPRDFAPTLPPSYGIVTQAAVSLIEISRPSASRSFCVASCDIETDASRPSTWSGAIDQIAAGALEGEREGVRTASETPKRLIFISAGNVTGALASVVADGTPISDPAQSWNALAIGGYTTKSVLTGKADHLAPMALANDLSPYSSSSCDMATDLLPIKPEVLFEAGNMTVDAEGYCDWHPELSLLAAGKDVTAEPLVPFWATSAAVGVAGHFMGQLQAAIPGYWPETYRALIVHSARWPGPIRTRLIGSGKAWKTGGKGEKNRLLRQVGFGVPQLDAAIRSAKNDFIMIAQTDIQPYASGASSASAVFNEVHFYDLPWPKTKLGELGEKPVMMRVTLSYFVEPNLSGKGATRPETYRSFGLRFALKRRGETEEEFRARQSQIQGNAILDDDFESDDDVAEGKAESTTNWLLGPKAISAGSLHCDIWRGKACDLIDHDAIAVHPVTGWWKTHMGKGRHTDTARYSLIMSIDAEGEEIDLYAEASTVLIQKEIGILIG